MGLVWVMFISIAKSQISLVSTYTQSSSSTATKLTLPSLLLKSSTGIQIYHGNKWVLLNFWVFLRALRKVLCYYVMRLLLFSHNFLLLTGLYFTSHIKGGLQLFYVNLIMFVFPQLIMFL